MSGAQRVGAGLVGAGGILSAESQISAGKQANEISKINQGQLNQNADLLDYSAKGAEATGINAASADKRKTKFALSKIIALNAADGGSSTDKNVAELLANTDAEGEYNALNDIYEGSTKATQLRNQAISERNQGAVGRYQGKQAVKASRIGAATSLIGAGTTGASFYGKYGMPSTATAGEF